MRDAAVALIVIAGIAASMSVRAQESDPFGDIMSLEDLLQTEISTASKYKQTSNEAPASITIITSDDIRRHGYRTLSDALQTVRGVYQSYDRMYHYVGARGIHSTVILNNQMLLLLNGQAMNESLFGATMVGNVFPINMEMVERIEIMRGPGSILYGTNAMFLVVNVITQDGGRFDSGSATVEIGGFGEKVASATYGATPSSETNLLLSVRTADIEGADYVSEEYGRTAVGADGERFTGVFGSMKRKGFRAHAFYASRRKGAPIGAYGTSFGDTDTEAFDERFVAQAEYEVSPSGTTNLFVRGFAFTSDNAGRFVNAIARPAWHSGVDHTVGGEARFVWDMRIYNRLTVGVEYTDHLRSSMTAATEAGTIFFDANMPYNVASVYAFNEYQAVKDVHVLLGVRHDRNSKDDSSATTPRGALIYQGIESATVKLVYGEAYRAPTFIERDFTIPFALRPNPNLVPERVRTAELIWEQRIAQDYYASVSVYHNQVSDLIVSGVRSRTQAAQFGNIGEARVVGVEVEAWARWSNHRGGYASYGYVDAESGVSGDALNYAPTHHIKFGASMPLWNAAVAAMDGRYMSSQFISDVPEQTVRRTLDGHFVLDATVTSKPILGALTLRLRVENALDASYRTPVSPCYDPFNATFVLDSGVQDGRQVIASANARF
ncbi:MAG: TonB-dependent receptor [Candidatus Poribacteria bacterium]|nr:TonB-dependent receptor [Candidatus Poribacteria bacterium]